MTTRRELLAVTATILSGSLASSRTNAADAPRRNGQSHMKLSLAAYSFRRYMARRGTPRQIKAARMTLEDFIRYCAELNLDGTELTGYYFPQDVTQAYLLSLKELTFRLGLDISGTAIGNDFCLPDGEKRDSQLALCREWIDYAATMGAPVIRIFAGSVPAGDTEDAARERCVAGINQSLEYAARKGVFLALENHGGITSTLEQLLRIVHAVDSSPWFGVNFDGGNFRSDDPYHELEHIAPFAINAQLKVGISRNGASEPADLPRIVGILRDAGYRGYVVLEYEKNDDPKKSIPSYVDQLRELIA